jgi:glycerol-3-phosphate dehydrogenase
MIIPKTKDGRVVFILPWEGKTIAGTTDVPIKPNPTIDPVPTVSEIDFILDSIEDYLKVKIPEKEVLSVWTGLRPLALPSGPLRVDSAVATGRDNLMATIAKLDPRIWRPDDKSDSRPQDDAPQSVTRTSEVVREHAIHIEPAANIITVVGGKWTTYRKMASDVVNLAVAQLKYTDLLPPALGGSATGKGNSTSSDQKIVVDPKIALQADNAVTRNLVLVGGEGLHTEKAKTELKATVQATAQISDEDVLSHLVKHYGTQTSTLVKEYLVTSDSAKPSTKIPVEANRKRLHPEYPILEGEVRYCAKYEQAVLPQDFVSRRARLSFLDVDAAQQVLPRVTDILAEENGWSKAQKEHALADARKHLSSFYVPGTAPTWSTAAAGAAVAAAAPEAKKGKPWWKFW